MTASHGSSPSLVLPAPLVRVLQDVHVEPSAHAGGPTFTIRQRVEVAAADFSDELLDYDLRIELLRRRKSKPVLNQGWRWVHPADHNGQTNALDGGRSRGGNHYDDNGNPMSSRVTTIPVVGEYDWLPVPLGAWWKEGQVSTFDGFTGQTGTTQIPVGVGGKAVNTYDAPPPHMPQWTVSGGVTRQRFAFRLSCIDPDGLDERDRLSGPVSAAKVVMKPIRASGLQMGFPVWPDGNGGAESEDTDRLGIWLEDN